MRLAVSKASWHYKYFRTLCEAWDLDKEYECKSLCSYTQIIVWFSFFVLLFSPFMIFGWLMMKICRTAYKLLCWSLVGRRVVRFLDRHLRIGVLLDTGAKDIENSPALSLVLIGGLSLIVLCVIFCVVMVVYLGAGPSLWGLWYFMSYCIPWAILHLPVGIWSGMLYAGFAIFYAFSVIGMLLMAIKTVGIVVTIWLVKYIGLIGAIFGTVLVILFIATIFVYLMIIFLRSSVGKMCINFLVFKYNGFRQEREAEKLRRIEEEKDRVEPRTELFNLLPYIRKVKAAFVVVWNVLKEMWERRKVRKKLEDEKEIHIMGLFSLVWNSMKAAKNNICPLLTFIDENEIKNDDAI